jgi:hypothetical protein
MSLGINNNKFKFLNLLSKKKQTILKCNTNNKNNERLLKNIQDTEKIKLIKISQQKGNLNDNNNTINKIDELFNPESLDSLKDDSLNIEQTEYQPIKKNEEKNEENKIKNKICMKYKKKNMNSNLTINLIKTNEQTERNINSKDKKDLFKINDFNGNLLNKNNSMINLKVKNDKLTQEINKRLLIEKTLKNKEKELFEANMIIQRLKKENDNLKKLTNFSENSLKYNSLNLSKLLDEEEIKKLNEEIRILKNDQQNNKNIIIELNSKIKLLKEENNNLKKLNTKKEKKK